MLHPVSLAFCVVQINGWFCADSKALAIHVTFNECVDYFVIMLYVHVLEALIAKVWDFLEQFFIKSATWLPNHALSCHRSCDRLYHAVSV